MAEKKVKQSSDNADTIQEPSRLHLRQYDINNQASTGASCAMYGWLLLNLLLLRYLNVQPQIFKDDLISTKDLHPKPRIYAHILKLLTPLQCVKVCIQEICAVKFDNSKKDHFLNPIHHELVDHQLKISYCQTWALGTAKI